MKIQLVTLLLLFSVAGCGTPGEVRDYAKTSGAQMTNMKQDLAGLSTREQGTLSIRRRTVAQLLLSAQQGEATLDNVEQREVTLAAQKPGTVCGTSCSTLLDLVVGQYQQREKNNAARAQEVQEALADLDSKLKPLDTIANPSITTLDAASKSAGSLGDEMTKAELAAFLFDYFKQVKAGVDEGQKQTKDAALTAASKASSH